MVHLFDEEIRRIWRGVDMVHVFEGDTSALIYRNQLNKLVVDPDHIVTVRGRPTRELLNVVTEIRNPRARCQIVPGRKLNPWLALSECLWLLAGRDDVASLSPYNKRIMEFSDDGETLYGAYGARIYTQIPQVIERLRKDSNDRRAVLTTWEKEDLVADTKDPPCNTQVMFKVRNEKLYMLVTNRSNDLHWGLHAVNLMQFGVLQEYIACRLGVGMGTQTHISNSLHIYTDKRAQAITDRMLGAGDESIEEIPAEGWLFPNPFPDEIGHAEFASLCGSVLDGTYGTLESPFPFLEFAEDFLCLYRGKDEKSKLGAMRHQSQFDSWIRMGFAFLFDKLIR